MMVPDLSPEQRFTEALCAQTLGAETAAWAVRGDRVTAYLLGAHLIPLVEQMAACVSRAVDEVS